MFLGNLSQTFDLGLQLVLILKYYFLKSLPIFKKNPLTIATKIIFKFLGSKRFKKKIIPLFLMTLNKTISIFANERNSG